MSTKVTEESAIDLNAKLNFWTPDGKIDFEADKEAARQYHLQYVNRRYQYFPSLEEKLDFLITNEYYEEEVFDVFSLEEKKELYKYAYGFKHRFDTLLGAVKFYGSYALKTFDGEAFLERFEDRVVANAIGLSGGDFNAAKDLIEQIITGRLQPATPTFSNIGKRQRGELVSCFILDIQDNMESIGRAQVSALQLSKRGGGVGLNVSNIREFEAPIKKIKGQSSGVVPVCKMLDDAFTYANQLGNRQGAGAVYISVHHPDVERLLDSKRENADEKTRLKTLSVGLVFTDVAYEKARTDDYIYQFSPYDVERVYGVPFSKVDITAEYDKMVDDSRIKKYKINARKFFQIVAELQFQSGYPYLMNIDTVNRENPIHGRIDVSNLCSEILQVADPSVLNEDLSYNHIGRDISCNLASLNIKKAMDGGDLGKTVEVGIRMLTNVSDRTSIESVPSVRVGNEKTHSVGLGQFSLHQFFLQEGMKFGDENSLNFTNNYFMAVNYHCLRTSNAIARERGVKFFEFEKSKYASAQYLIDRYAADDMINPNENTRAIFDKFGITLPTFEDWEQLAFDIEEYGLYNAYLQAVPPTGSISYINGGTSSIHPAVAVIEARKEGKTGRVYYPTPGVTNDNFKEFEDAYQIGPFRIIDVYAEAQKHVDQGMSLTLFYTEKDTTKTLNKAWAYAHHKGVKTIYYARVRSENLEGTNIEECVSCTL